MAGVLVAGNIVLDTVARPGDDIIWGGTRWIESLEQHLGGNAANTSYTTAKLGVAARILAYVGQDPFGEMAVAKLSEGGVDLRFLVRSATEPTAASVALIARDGQRAFLHRPGVSLTGFSEPPSFTGALVDGMTHFHLANPFGMLGIRRHAPEMLRRAKEAGLCVSLDTAWDSKGEWSKVFDPCLPYLDTLFVNETEADMLTRHGSRLEAPLVVRKLGALGCEVNGVPVPGFQVECIDTTGAGDCFAGAFLAATIRGESPVEAARFANAVGAMNVTRLGGVSGVADYEATCAWMRSR